MNSKIKLKWKIFADEYIRNGGNATQAYISAGYSENGANRSAQKLLSKTVISQYIAEKMEQIEKEQHRDIMSLAEIQERRSRIARGEVIDGLGFAPDFSDQLKAMDSLEKVLMIAERQKVENEEKENREKAAMWTIPITDITSDFVAIYRTVHEALRERLMYMRLSRRVGEVLSSRVFGEIYHMRQSDRIHKLMLFIREDIK